MKKAIIIVDMLNDFVTGSLKCERAEKIIPNIKKLAEAARKAGTPVIYSNDAHIKEIDGEFSVWGEHALAGTKGAEVIPELSPVSGDFIIPKRRYSGFFCTEMDMLLRELKTEEVIICGLHTHLCVRHTSADAFFLGYKITVPSDCVDSFTDADHFGGLEYLKMAYKARITTADEMIGEISQNQSL
ncbi:nicotinamidase [Candidatus Micrarchaeota archaeon CG11_big_fil_rev_8_21_14_0_20_47_5]|nr:MAG: nicotinamidase [Candidatus Micrarchaeota archaeon CG1_02_47_40]PIN82857.1 MAG: nicotinamidase [Candidatus Micrarchaeota archaeon CG11_big_fil_rev_8_21_14_0_20_47_5]